MRCIVHRQWILEMLVFHHDIVFKILIFSYHLRWPTLREYPAGGANRYAE